MSEVRIVLPSPVEEAMPWRGPCALCGCSPDARHRVLDAIYDYTRDPDCIDDVAADYVDYGLSVEVVTYIAEHYNPDDETWTVPA